MTYHHRVAVPRIIAPGGPVSAALRTILANVESCDRQRVRDLRQAIAARIEADLALLDALDGDPDSEPSLGSPERSGSHDGWALGRTFRDITTGQKHWADGSGDEHEHENEHGGDIQDEPHDEEPDREPTLCGLTVRSADFHRGGAFCGEVEPSLGSLGGTAAGCDRSQERWSGGDLSDREVCPDADTHRQEPIWRQPGEALTKVRDLARALRPIARQRDVIFDQRGAAHAISPIGRRA